MVVNVHQLLTMDDEHTAAKNTAILLLLNRENGQALSSATLPNLDAPSKSIEKPRRRVRRRYNQILRRFCCSYPQCTKSYGSLNHLNAHIVTKKHGQRKSRADFQFGDDAAVSAQHQVYPGTHNGLSASSVQHYLVNPGWPSRRDQASGTYWYGMPVRPLQAPDVVPGPLPQQQQHTLEPVAAPLGRDARGSMLNLHSPGHFAVAEAPAGASGMPPGPPGAPMSSSHPPFPGYILYRAPFPTSASVGGPPGWISQSQQQQQPPPPPPTHFLALSHYLPAARESRSSSTSSSKLPIRSFASPPLFSAHNLPQRSTPQNITLPPMLPRIPSSSSLPPLNIAETVQPKSVPPTDSSSSE